MNSPIIILLSELTEELQKHGFYIVKKTETKTDLLIVDDCGAEMIDVESFVDE